MEGLKQKFPPVSYPIFIGEEIPSNALALGVELEAHEAESIQNETKD